MLVLIKNSIKKNLKKKHTQKNIMGQFEKSRGPPLWSYLAVEASYMEEMSHH